MLCNEGHRKALISQKERDKTQYRTCANDLAHHKSHALIGTHASLSDQDMDTDLFDSMLMSPFNYQDQNSSLCDLEDEKCLINVDQNDKTVSIKCNSTLNQIQLNDSDYDSDLNDKNTLIDKQDPTQVYLQACKQYRIHPYNSVIEGLKTNIIDLSDMSINDLDLKAICLALRMQVKTKSIRLCSNNITAQGCVYLQEALKDNYKVEEIDISKNSIKTEGIEILSSSLLSEMLDIIFHIACHILDSDGPILKKIIQGGEMLQELYLSRNQLSTISCKNIGLALTSIDKKSKGKYDFMFINLEDAPELTILDLSWNAIRENDIRPICNSLKESKNNQSLERLNLMMNGLGNQGAIAIANVLSNNDTLIELNLSNNRIEKDGANILASKLEKNRRLKKLWCGNNNISTLGSLILLKAVDHIKSQVEYLNIENVLVNDDFIDLYIQINQYLRPLEVVHGGVRGKLGRLHPNVPGFTIMDDIDLQCLDTKSLHALFQRDPFKILVRMAKEGGYDLLKALKKWDMEEHGSLTYSIYIIDFPSAVKDSGLVLDKTLHFILWNYLKRIARKGSVSYFQFITPIPKSNILKPSIKENSKSSNH